MNNIGTTTLRHPQLLYASSRNNSKQRNNSSSGKTIGSGTTTTTVNSNPQGLWLELAREHRNHTKQASNPGTTCKLA